MEAQDYVRISETVAKQLQRGGLPSYVEFDDLKQAAGVALLKAQPAEETLAYKMARDAAIDEWRGEERHWEGPRWERAEMPIEEEADDETEDGLDAGRRVTHRSQDCIPTATDHSELYGAIAALPPRQREAVRLHYLDGMTAADVARKMNITLEGSERNIERGLAALRKKAGLVKQ